MAEFCIFNESKSRTITNNFTFEKIIQIYLAPFSQPPYFAIVRMIYLYC
jgi:hypothetical protein